MTDSVPTPEQQGEPVCARCGHTAHEDDCGHVWTGTSVVRGAVLEQDAYCECPPAPPSSEHHEDTVEAMMLWRDRAEAAEARVTDLGVALTNVRAEKVRLENQAAKLRKALTLACAWLSRIIDHYDPTDTEGGREDVAEWRRLIAETAQEGVGN